MRLKICLYIIVILAFTLLASCESFKQKRAEKAIEEYVQDRFFSPASFHAKRFYKPARLNFTEEDAKTANEMYPGRNEKPSNGWVIAVDFEALMNNGEKNEQSAAFHLNLSCDSVISSDVVAVFLKKD